MNNNNLVVDLVKKHYTELNELINQLGYDDIESDTSSSNTEDSSFESFIESVIGHYISFDEDEATIDYGQFISLFNKGVIGTGSPYLPLDITHAALQSIKNIIEPYFSDESITIHLEIFNGALGVTGFEVDLCNLSISVQNSILKLILSLDYLERVWYESDCETIYAGNPTC